MSNERIQPFPARSLQSTATNRLRIKASHRWRQLRFLWEGRGLQGVVGWARRAAVQRLAPPATGLPVLATDVLACDMTSPKSWSPLMTKGDEPLTINWITTPPARGSGGHTTMFRLIEHLQRSGHRCRVYIYDVRGGSTAYYASVVRNIFPWFTGEVCSVSNGMAGAHAVFATSWQTAYPAYNDPCRGKRFYLVQDFEPWFYSAGSCSTLAENTYRMGFHAITAGKFLAGKLKSEYGMAADAFDFGCDVNKYHLLAGNHQRDGIVFYAKPDAPRRSFELGILALQIFARRHPRIAIHFYGSHVGSQAFPFIDHGVLSPDDLNRVYNRCFAGLCLSMTNVSLVPHEMLSAGCIPVLNDAEHNHIVLDNSHVRYAQPTPHALAAALNDVIATPDFSTLATSASASVSAASWDDAGRAVEQSIRDALRA